MKSKFAVAGAAMAAALMLAACGPKNNNNASNNAGSPATRNMAVQSGASPTSQNSPVVATVNGQPIHEATLDAMANELSHGRKVPPQIKQQLLHRLVQVEVLSQTAHDKGIADDPQVQAEMRVQRKVLLAKALVGQYMKKHPVTNEEIKSAYQKQVQSMDKTQYKARHILVDKKKTAEKAIKKLDNGADFAKLAKKMSTGPSAKNGGELGWFSPSDMVKPFSDAVEKLKKGHYTKQPVKTQFGWHVILLQDKRPVEKPKLKDMKAGLKQKLGTQRVKNFVNSRVKQANVDIKKTAPTPKPASQAMPAPSSAAMPAPSSTMTPGGTGNRK
jgi:peptidyl-prolyl cis-trans isomerase C